MKRDYIYNDWMSHTRRNRVVYRAVRFVKKFQGVVESEIYFHITRGENL